MICTVEITTAENITYVVRNVISIRIHQSVSVMDWIVSVKRSNGSDLNYMNVNPITGFKITECSGLQED